MSRLLRPFKFIFCICEDVNGSVTVDEHDSDLGARSVIHACALTKGPSDYKIATGCGGAAAGTAGLVGEQNGCSREIGSSQLGRPDPALRWPGRCRHLP